MAIVYRTAGAWGAGKGSNLTPAEVDANFYELSQQIAGALSDIEDPVALADITYDNGTITFHLTDETERGPFDLPVAVFRWRGRYQGSATYAEMDCIFHPALGGYLVLQDHVAPPAFNPNLTIGGNPVYRQMFRLIPGGHLTIKTVASTSYTLVESDASSYLRMTASASATVQVPTNDSVPFPIGTEVTLWSSAGAVLVGSAGGVTVNRPAGVTGIPEDGGAAMLKKVDTNEWDLWLMGGSSELPTEAPSFTEPPSFPPTEPTSEPPPSDANMIAGAGEFNAVGYSENWTGEGSFGQIFNPISGYTIRGLFDVLFAGYPTLMMIESTETDAPPYLAVTIEGLGTRYLDYVMEVEPGIQAYGTENGTDLFGFVDGHGYTITSITVEPKPTETETPSVSEPSEAPSGMNLRAAEDQFYTGYWETWDQGFASEPPSVTPHGLFYDRNTSLSGWKVITLVDRRTGSIHSPEVGILYDGVTEGWEPPTGGTEWPAAPSTLYARVTGPSLTDGTEVRLFTLPWKYRALTYPYEDVYGFAGTGFYDLFGFRENDWYNVELSFTPF